MQPKTLFTALIPGFVMRLFTGSSFQRKLTGPVSHPSSHRRDVKQSSHSCMNRNVTRLTVVFNPVEFSLLVLLSEFGK